MTTTELTGGRFREAGRVVRDVLGAGPRVPRSPKGVALLLVLMVVAILTAFSAEYQYKAYVRLHVASNMRDEVSAYYHARSAMEVARLVVKSQNIVSNMLSAIAAFAPNMKNQNIELWTFACEFANAFCTGKLQLMGKPFFDFTGMGGVGVEEGGFCKCRAQPEDGRININKVDTPEDKQGLFTELYGELIQHREGKLEVGEVDRETMEIALNVIDWADSDKTKSDFVNGQVTDAAGGEGAMGKGLVEPKNAKFDTLEELRLVEGMTPNKYCAVADKLTPYATQKLNINTAALSTLRRILCASAAPGTATACLGYPTALDLGLFCSDMCRTLRQALMSPGWGNVNQFLTLFDKLPPEWGDRPTIQKDVVGQKLGTQSKVIRIETVGGSYGTYRGLSAVIDTGSGEFVYWNEN
jgi:type II secretory pathway component PulK